MKYVGVEKERTASAGDFDLDRSRAGAKRIARLVGLAGRAISEPARFNPGMVVTGDHESSAGQAQAYYQ